MNTPEKMQQRVQDEVFRIADEIMREAREEDGALFWTPVEKKGDSEDFQFFELSLYGGSAGIALFFGALFRYTGQKKYLDIIDKIVKGIDTYSHTCPPFLYTFQPGMFGVVYALIQLYLFTGKRSYLEKASELARHDENFLHNPEIPLEIINGKSGALLVLLHLHSHTGEAWILEKIDQYLQQLTSQFHTAKKGIYWDRNEKQVGGLCGFSHGAAGIGFALMEAGKYLGNPALTKIGEQAYTYETQYFVPRTGNWRDLRYEAVTEQDPMLFEEKADQDDLNFFSGKGEMNAWCHGAAGIGMSRLRAWELNGSPAFRKEAMAAIRRNFTEDFFPEAGRESHTLCHGTCGNNDIFIQAFLTLKQEKYLRQALRAAMYVIESRRLHGYYQCGYPSATGLQDMSLFMGNAGIGYYLLRVLAPELIPSVLAPSLEKKAKPGTLTTGEGIGISWETFKKRWIKKDFPRTFEVAEFVAPKPTEAFLQSEFQGNLTDAFSRFVRRQLEIQKHEKHKTLWQDIYRLELKSWQLKTRIKSNVYLHYKEIACRSNAEKHVSKGDPHLKKLSLLLHGNSALVSVNWDWRSEITGNQPESDLRYVLLRPYALGVHEEWLPDFSFYILRSFKKPKQVQEVIREVIEMTGAQSESEKEMAEKAVLQQVSAALRRGILLDK